MIYKNLKVAAVITALIIAAVTSLMGIEHFKSYTLTLQDGKTGKIYGEYKIKENQEFSVGFIHSVNQSPVTDFFTVKHGKIFVTKTIYFGFGAGVQTQIEEGQTLSYGDDGSMIVTGFNKEIPRLSYIVGTVSDHILKINDKEISLRDLCGKNANICFRVSKSLF